MKKIKRANLGYCTGVSSLIVCDIFHCRQDAASVCIQWWVPNSPISDDVGKDKVQVNIKCCQLTRELHFVSPLSL